MPREPAGRQAAVGAAGAAQPAPFRRRQVRAWGFEPASKSRTTSGPALRAGGTRRPAARAVGRIAAGVGAFVRDRRTKAPDGGEAAPIHPPPHPSSPRSHAPRAPPPGREPALYFFKQSGSGI